MLENHQVIDFPDRGDCPENKGKHSKCDNCSGQQQCLDELKHYCVWCNDVEVQAEDGYCDVCYEESIVAKPVRTYINRVKNNKKNNSYCQQCSKGLHENADIVLRIHLYSANDTMGIPFCCQNCHDIWEADYYLRIEKSEI